MPGFDAAEDGVLAIEIWVAAEQDGKGSFAAVRIVVCVRHAQHAAFMFEGTELSLNLLNRLFLSALSATGRSSALAS